MFSYRHGFHAGNHGDVLKHCILVQILAHLNAKDTPYWVVDTHAGAGMYALDGHWAQKSAESASGVARLLQHERAPRLVDRYLQALREANGDGALKNYPGSPCLALMAMRAHDRLRLFELHPTEVRELGNTMVQLRISPRQTAIEHADGFAGLRRLLPPPSKRGLVIIDPSYEDKRDYRSALQAIRDGQQRFAHGTYLLWYPLVQRLQATELARSLERLQINWLHATLSVKKPGAEGLGMHGSGVFVVNPPWTLHDELKEALPWLLKTLAQDERARYTLSTTPARRKPA